MNLDKKEFDQIMGKLSEINKNIALSKVLHLDRDMAKARYADLASLEALAKSEKVECPSRKYECSGCNMSKRNKCWAAGQKSLTRKKLIKGVPYSKEQLSEMRISALWMLAGHLDIQIVGRQAGQLVQDIHAAQRNKSKTKGVK